MRAAERAERNAEILRLFLAGHNYREIGLLKAVSTSQVELIVKRELADNARRRNLLTDEALAMWQERYERLFRAHWDQALAGDHRSAEICRKMLGQQARLYGLEDLNSPSPLPPPTSPLPPDENDDEDEGPADELARIRAARTGTA